jgi:hypothetical protein
LLILKGNKPLRQGAGPEVLVAARRSSHPDWYEAIGFDTVSPKLRADWKRSMPWGTLVLVGMGVGLIALIVRPDPSAANSSSKSRVVGDKSATVLER